MSQRARKLFLVEDVDRGGLGLTRGEQQGRCWHDDRELRDEVSPSLYAAIDPDAAASSGLRLSNGRVEKFWNTDAIEHFAHVRPAMFVGAHTAQQYATTALVPCASELSTDTWEKSAFRNHADVSFREQQKLSKNSLLVLREVSR